MKLFSSIPFLPLTLIVATLSLYFASPAYALSGDKTIVRATAASVYERADTTAPVRLTIKIGSVIEVRQENGAWCNVHVPSSSNSNQHEFDGWMRTADLVRSAGMAQFWDRDYRRAAASLEAESRTSADPIVTTWLNFFLGYSQWAMGRLDLSRATFDAVAHRRPSTEFSTDAFVAASKLASIQGDFPGALTYYEQLLAAAPEYRLQGWECNPAINPYPNEWARDSEMCAGDPFIGVRTRTLRQLIAAQATADRVRGDANATALQKATASYNLGQALEEKNLADPGETMLRGTLIVNTDVRGHYQSVVDTAPGSSPAGQAAWRLIALSAPYEWEGAWEAEATWMIEQYGKFLADYPRHELAPEARFKVAVGTWAKGGYTEALGITMDSAGWDAIHKRQAYLEQWFDTYGFGAGTLSLPRLDPSQAVKAQQMFRDIVSSAPTTPSAAMAQYYVAVIADECLNQPDKALPELETFVRQYSNTDPFVDKARKRIAAIRSGK